MTGRFPRQANAPEVVLDSIALANGEIKRQVQGRLRGKPDMPPFAVALSTLAELNSINPNNSGVHTLKSVPLSSDTPICPWQPTRDMEQEVVLQVASLFGFVPTAVDGQVVSGSSEGNIAALWMRRNASAVSEAGRKLRVLGGRTAHYSVLKAADLLGLGPKSVELVALDEAYAMDILALRVALRGCAETGNTTCVVVATAGATVTGAVDPVDEICDTIAWARESLQLDVHLHIDAAIGGLILPFLTTDELPAGLRPHEWGRRDEVGSLTLDFHKLGGVPYGAGVLVTRKGLIQRVKRDIAMVSTGYDATLLGSRSGATAASIWAVVQALGFEGFRRQALHCIELRARLRSALATIPELQLIAESPLNVVAFSLGGTEPPPFGKVMRAHHIYRDAISRSESAPSRSIYPCFLMPHNSAKEVDTFVAEVAGALG